MRRCALYETHQLETGVGSVMQRAVLKSKLSQVVVISNQLKTLLAKHYKVSSSNFFILRDAAPQNLFSKSDSNDECLFLSKEREKESAEKTTIGYFGHLYFGRGIDIIISLAESNPDITFIICGEIQNN